MGDKQKVPVKPKIAPKTPPPKQPPSTKPDVIKGEPERGPLLPPRKR